MNAAFFMGMRLGIWRTTLIALGVITLSSSVTSQPPPPRTQFVLNLYVDPLHGDDAHATSFNPAPSGFHYLSSHPAPMVARQPGGQLIHVPYSFRTVSAALSYIKTNFSDLTLIPPQSWGDKAWYNSEADCYVDHIVIQCLPGLYGPFIDPLDPNPADNLSGMPWNGETFPLLLPDRVAIQGTSALNTIFDARHQVTSIFGFHATPQHVDDTYTFCRVFIDGITIRGARGDGKPDGQAVPTGAGVMIDDGMSQVGGVTIEMTVSNCFIVDNSVGIAISSRWSNAQHQPRIINNTIAWNGIGLWNGRDCRIVNPASPLVAVHKPLIVNTIFDHSSPNLARATLNWYNQVIVGCSAFEGLSAHDTTVHKLNGVYKHIDYNAYDPTMINLSQGGGALPTNWPTGWPPVQPATVTTFTPRVDLAPYITSTNPQWQRHVLYINDVFWWYTNSSTLPLLPQNFDHSPHDFRLPLAVTPDGGGVFEYNPLIDRGLDMVGGAWVNPAGGNFELVMGKETNPNHSGYQYALEVPGIPSSGLSGAPIRYGAPGSFSDYATYLCNDFDAEGYGNPRRFDHPAITGPGQDITDIGADEVGTLIMAGYVNGTTIFSKHPNTRGINKPVSTFENTEVYFFGFPGASYNRPRYTILPGQSCSTRSGNQLFDWWRYLWRKNPGVSYVSSNSAATPISDGNYTRGSGPNTIFPPLSLSWRAFIVENYKNGGIGGDRDVDPFPGNLLCDYSPHLMMDNHANWALPYDPWDWRLTTLPLKRTTFRFDPYNTTHVDGGFKPGHGDAFSSNPWVRNPADDTLLPDEWEAAHGTDNENLFYTRNLLDTIFGNLNPPGTWYTSFTSGEVTRLSLHLPIQLNFDPEASMRTIYTCNTWGFGDANIPPAPWDTIPYTGALWAQGYRWNCEVERAKDPSPQTSNLQSFLGINWDTGKAASSSTFKTLLPGKIFIEESKKSSLKNLQHTTRFPLPIKK